MIDLAEIWRWLRSQRGQAEGAGLVLPDIIKSNFELFDDFVLPARIQHEPVGEYFPEFEFHPRPDLASTKSWAWILAVRGDTSVDLTRMREAALSPGTWWRHKNSGAMVEALEFALRTLDDLSNFKRSKSDLNEVELRVLDEWCLHQARLRAGADEQFDVSFLMPAIPETYSVDSGAERGEAFSQVQEMLRRWHADISAAATMEALMGREIYDLVAVSANFSKILGRFLGHSVVLGYPQRSEEEERPVRLFRDLKSFIAGFCGGALLVGTADENYRWLAACDGGIVTDDIAHGKAVKKILTRPYIGPKVFITE